MKASMTALMSVATLLSAATANFDIYWTTVGGVGGSANGYGIFNNHPGCEEAKNGHTWGVKDDVSGNKRGFRCKGDGCFAKNGEITELEMNFSSDLHWTIYKDRDYEVTDLDGKVHGNCIKYPDEEFACNVGPIGITNGYRKMRCLVDLTADDINP